MKVGMEIRNVRVEPGFKSGSVQVACGICGLRRRKPGRFYVRWELSTGRHRIGTICGECFAKEVFNRFETNLPVGRVRKAKRGVCSCGRDAVGGVKLILQHSPLEQEEVFMCAWCVQVLTKVEGV